MKTGSFEELTVWQEAMRLSSTIYRYTNSSSFSNDYALIDQMRRSAVSVPSNISEGYERDSSKEFIRFLRIAKGSLGELRTQVLLAIEFGYISHETGTLIIEQTYLLAKKISSLVKYLVRKAE